MKGNFISISNVDLFTTYKSIIYKRIQILSSPSLFSFFYHLITILLFSIQVNIYAQSNKPEVVQITGRLLDQNKKPLSNFSISLLECLVGGYGFISTENCHDTLYNIAGLLKSDQKSWNIEGFYDEVNKEVNYKSPCDSQWHSIWGLEFKYIGNTVRHHINVIVKYGLQDFEYCKVSTLISFFNHLGILVLERDTNYKKSALSFLDYWKDYKPICSDSIRQYVPLFEIYGSLVGMLMPIKYNNVTQPMIGERRATCTTEETGEFTFNKKNLSPGTYTILLDDASKRPEFLTFIVKLGQIYPAVLTSNGWPLTINIIPNQINKDIGDIIVNTDLEKMK